VPRIGEVIERDGIRLEVLAGDELKVEQVRVSKVARETVPETRS
jgi:CBS domain containing-hemolysin-like protein